jgi:hypothetical protein
MITAVSESLIFLYVEGKGRTIGSIGEMSIGTGHQDDPGERYIACNRQWAWVGMNDIPRVIARWVQYVPSSTDALLTSQDPA